MTSPPKSNGNKKESPNNKDKYETKIVKKEEKDDDKEDEDEEEEGGEEDVMKEQEVSLKLNRSLAWFQAPLPPEKNSYTPVHILPSASSSTSSGEDSSAVKDSLDHSIDCVRNEVLEVLTKTIYSVARSLRSDPVSEIRSLPPVYFLVSPMLSYTTDHDMHFFYFFPVRSLCFPLSHCTINIPLLSHRPSSCH